MIVATFLDRELAGTALWAIDPESGSVAWKTVLGAPWHTELTRAGSPPAFSMITRDGRELTISDDQAARGGFVVSALPRPGAFALPAGKQLRVERDGKVLDAIVAKPFSKSLWLPDSTRPGGWRELALPATVAADPLVWQGGILVPGADGRVYLIDPSNGRSMAEPFVPKFDRDHQGSWLRLAPRPRDRDPGRHGRPGPPPCPEDHARARGWSRMPSGRSTSGSSPTRRRRAAPSWWRRPTARFGPWRHAT